MFKGPFWVVGKEILSYPIEIFTQLTPSHEDVWKFVSGEYKRKSWNYFPRGRVEIRNEKAIIFANSNCFLHENFEIEIRSRFDLANTEIVFKSDNSAHYQYKMNC